MSTTSAPPESDPDPPAIDADQPASNPDPDHRKPCTLCSRPCNVRVRCQIDKTGKWHFVCPGKCWTSVSGGVIDGDKSDEHRYYRYGGMWKNKHDAVSAKKPKKKKKKKDKGERVDVQDKDGSGEHEAAMAET